MADRKLYIIGGLNNAGALGTVESYDPVFGFWGEAGGDLPQWALLRRLAGKGDEVLAVGLLYLVEVQQVAQVGLLYPGPVEFDSADLGAGPAKALGDFFAGQARALAQAPQLGGEPAAPDGGTTTVRQTPGLLLVSCGPRRCDFTGA